MEMRVVEGLNNCVDKGKGGGGKISPRFEEKGEGLKEQILRRIK